MSHVEKCRATLEVVNKDLLEAALNVVCGNFGVERSFSIDSKYQGRNLQSFNGKTFLVAIRTQECPEGVGVMLTGDGKIEFAYDYDGHRAGQKKIMDAIEKNYTALALGIALKKTGFSVESTHTATHTVGGQIHLRAVR